MSGESIHDAWQAGRAAWPGVELALSGFTEFVAALPAATHQRFAADLYLAAACSEGNANAIAAFDRELLAPVRATIRSIDGRDDFLDEALQRLRASLLVGDGGRPRIAQYAGRGSLKAWVAVSAVRSALGIRRVQLRSREVLDEDWTAALATISTNDPELELLKHQYASAFARALRDAIGALEPRLRAALRMNFVEDASIDEIGRLYSVHRATAARWIQRACDAVFAETRRSLIEQLALSGTELDRMTALVRSQLDVSISQLLPQGIAETDAEP